MLKDGKWEQRLGVKYPSYIRWRPVVIVLLCLTPYSHRTVHLFRCPFRVSIALNRMFSCCLAKRIPSPVHVTSEQHSAMIKSCTASNLLSAFAPEEHYP